MTRTAIAVAAGAGALVVVVALGVRVLRHEAGPDPERPPGAANVAADAHPGFLYGRVTTVDGAKFEGRMRFGGDEEAYWTDAFNGVKAANPWAAYVPEDRLPRTERPVEIFGLEIARRRTPVDLTRPFMARFGDISRIDARGADVLVTLKSGTPFALDRMDASDFDDGVRVWDAHHGVVDLDSMRIGAIELLPSPARGTVPERLRGTVRTIEGETFAGFVQWNREAGVVTDQLHGRTADGAVSFAFDRLLSIERDPGGGCRATLADGGEVVLSGTRAVDRGNRGVYVDDTRFGRVLVPWEAFERIDFAPAGTGPVYGDFPPGSPLTGRVLTRPGRRLVGRIVFDLDESETTESLDAPAAGVDYLVPFGRIASIALPGAGDPDPGRVTVTLDGGRVVRLERAGDLGEGNAGVLVFVEGLERPEYVAWNEVERIEFGGPESPSR